MVVTASIAIEYGLYLFSYIHQEMTIHIYTHLIPWAHESQVTNSISIPMDGRTDGQTDRQDHATSTHL